MIRSQYTEKGKSLFLFVVSFVMLTLVVPNKCFSSSYLIQEGQDKLSNRIAEIAYNFQVPIDERLVDLNFEETNLQEVLNEFSRQAGIYFSIKSEVLKEKKVTYFAENKKALEALVDVLHGTGLTAEVSDNRRAVIIKEQKEQPVVIIEQEIITGRVTDAVTGEPLPGVNVSLEGSTIGTSTDADGNFEFGVPSLQGNLVFTYIGYERIEVDIAGRNNVNIELTSEVVVFGDELVVIGYGTMQRRHLTGSIGTVQVSEVAEHRPLTDFGQALYGKVAGVQIQKASGEPGAGQSSIQIRGINSLSAAIVPLVVVDGIPMPDFDLYTLNPSDIESIDILKDAASAAIYGSRGSNGVILVTTKSGNRGDVQVNFNYGFTTQSIMRRVDSMDGPGYAEVAKDAAQIAWIRTGGDPNAPNTIEARGERKYTWPSAFDTPETLLSTDWYDLIYSNAPMHRADLSLSGGDQNSTYHIAFGLLDQDGIGINTDYKRYSLNLRADTRLQNWLRVGGQVNTSFSDADRTGLGDTEVNVNQYPQLYPVYSEDGYLGGPHNTPGFEPWTGIYSAVSRHPLRPSTTESDRQISNVIGNAFAEFEMLPGLAFRSSFSGLIRRTDNRSHQLKDGRTAPDDIRRGSVSRSQDRIMSYTLENRLHYTTNWNDHQIDAIAGYEFNKRENLSVSASRQDFDNDLIPYLSGGATVNNANDSADEYTLISMLGRVNYNYLGRYMASVSFRRDGSSRFGPESKWGNFSSISAGWNVGDESFMDGFTFLSNLTMRGSYGLTGNDGIGNYNWMSSLSLNRVAIGNSIHTTYQPSSVPNPELRWERTKMLNFGLDVGLFDDRIRFEGEFYTAESDGLLLNVPVPSFSGFTSQLQNIGAVQNKGVELSLQSHNVSTSQFQWTSNITFSRNRGEVTALGPDNAPMFLQPPGTFSNFIGVTNQIGEAPFSFYGLVYDGVFMNQAEIDAYEAEYPHKIWPGMARFKDINGDGVINDLDRTILGNPQPDFIWAFSNSFNYRNFDFSFLIHGHVGGDLFDGNWRRSMYWQGRNFNNLAHNRWRSEEDPGDGYIHAISIDIASTLEITPSSYFLQDFTYTRLKDVTLGYTLSPGLTERIGIRGARFYLNATNLFTWQNNLAIDPENTFDRTRDFNPYMGVQQSSYPTAKTFTLGVNLQF